MNTTPPPNEPSYPSLQAFWHKMIRRCRAGDRAIALQLCRSAYLWQNGGLFPALRSQSDFELGALFRLSARQVQRLRHNSPLWHWEGEDLYLFFVGAPREDGKPTPQTYGKRRARHAASAAARKRREAGRKRLEPRGKEYPILDNETLLAADEDEFFDD